MFVVEDVFGLYHHVKNIREGLFLFLFALDIYRKKFAIFSEISKIVRKFEQSAGKRKCLTAYEERLS
ncbi:hypothetical protein COE03_15625 [Bacillus thuringiensis]|nr:hypothetical protein COE03_15625 [Bacillus thuringiensis]